MFFKQGRPTCGLTVTTKPKTAVIVPSAELLEERGRVLGEVLELADGLPVRHRAILRYPVTEAERLGVAEREE